MWLPNSDEIQYFKHYERDLINSVTKQRPLPRPRIFAVRDATSKSTWKKSLTALPVSFWRVFRGIRLYPKHKL